MLQICLALSFLSSGYPAVAIGLDAKRVEGLKSSRISASIKVVQGLSFLWCLGWGVADGLSVAGWVNDSGPANFVAVGSMRTRRSASSSWSWMLVSLRLLLLLPTITMFLLCSCGS